MESQRIRTLAMIAVGLAGVAVMAQTQTTGIVGSRTLPGVEYTDPRTNPTLTHRMTKSFQEVTLSEVLAWMSLNEASFVADSALLPDARTISVSFEDNTLAECMQIIARQVDGRWEANGEIFTLRSNTPPAPPAAGQARFCVEVTEATAGVPQTVVGGSVAALQAGSVTAPPTTTFVRPISGAYSLGTENFFNFAISLVGATEPSTAEWIGGEMAQDRSFSDEWTKQFDLRLKRIEERLDRLEVSLRVAGAPDRKLLDELRTETRAARAFQSAPREFYEFGRMAPIPPVPPVPPVAMKPMPPIRMKGDQVDEAWIKEVEQWAREFANAQSKWAKEFERTQAEWTKNFESKQAAEMAQLAKEFALVEVKPMDAERMKELAKEMALKASTVGRDEEMQRLRLKELYAAPNVFVRARQAPAGSKAELSKFMDSLTAEQKFTMTKQGYLKASDLTTEQRALLGNLLPASGKGELAFNLNGKKVKIRN